MRTSSRHVALILFDEVELLDVAACAEVLSLAGRQWNWRPFKVVPTAAEAGLVETRNQVSVAAREDLATAPVPEIIVVPGGYGAAAAAKNKALVAWIKAHAPQTTHLLAIGAGSLLLGAAGALVDRTVAIPRDSEAALHELAPNTKTDTDVALLVDDDLITARTSAAAIDATLQLVASILGAKQAMIVANHLGHEWSEDAGAPKRLEIDIVDPILKV